MRKGGAIVTVNPHDDGAVVVAHGKEADRRREMIMLRHVRGSRRGAENDGYGRGRSRGERERERASVVVPVRLKVFHRGTRSRE